MEGDGRVVNLFQNGNGVDFAEVGEGGFKGDKNYGKKGREVLICSIELLRMFFFFCLISIK